jgi:hypothetical protein
MVAAMIHPFHFSFFPYHFGVFVHISERGLDRFLEIRNFASLFFLKGEGFLSGLESQLASFGHDPLKVTAYDPDRVIHADKLF